MIVLVGDDIGAVIHLEGFHKVTILFQVGIHARVVETKQSVLTAEFFLTHDVDVGNSLIYSFFKGA